MKKHYKTQVVVSDTHAKAVKAVKDLKESDFAMSKVSLLGEAKLV